MSKQCLAVTSSPVLMVVRSRLLSASLTTHTTSVSDVFLYAAAAGLKSSILSNWIKTLTQQVSAVPCLDMLSLRLALKVAIDVRDSSQCTPSFESTYWYDMVKTVLLICVMKTHVRSLTPRNIVLQLQMMWVNDRDGDRDRKEWSGVEKQNQKQKENARVRKTFRNLHTDFLHE